MESKEIRLVRKDAILDNTQVDIVQIAEQKYRTTPAKLKEKKVYLETNIATWQAELIEVNALIATVYEEIQKQ